MYSFGAPRMGNHAFKALYDDAVPDSYRIINENDMVPTFPPALTWFGGMFCHVGKEVCCPRHSLRPTEDEETP